MRRLPIVIGLGGAVLVLAISQLGARASRPTPERCITVTVVQGAVKRVIDGDTFILYSVGVPAEERIRVLGVNAPEIGKVGADSATVFTKRWLAAGEFQIEACKRDSFGRLLALVTRGASNLATDLINAGWGVKYP